jgi:hypothetical protein
VQLVVSIFNRIPGTTNVNKPSVMVNSIVAYLFHLETGPKVLVIFFSSFSNFDFLSLKLAGS